MNKNKTQVTVCLLNDQLAFVDNLANQQIVSRGHAVRQIIKEMMNTGVPSNLTLNERVNYLENERFKLLSSIKDLESQVNYIEGLINVK